MGNRSLEFLVVKPEWVVLLGALADVGLVLMARIMWRELRSVGARRAGFALDAATLLVAAAAPPVYLLLGVPWVVAALYVPVTVLYWSPRLVVWITGGPVPLHARAKARSNLATRRQRIVAADTSTRLTERQAYDAFIEYLRGWPRETDELNLRDVGSGIDPTVWADGSPADPAVPSDWAKAAATVLNVEAGRSIEDDHAPAFPETDWLGVLHSFVSSLWPVLGNIPLTPLIAILEEKDSALPGSDVSPWRLWTQATHALLRETS